MFTTFSTDNLHILSASNKDIAIWNISSSENISRLPLNHPAPVPSHIQMLKFDLAASLASDGFWQPSATIGSIRRYFSEHHAPQLYYNQETRAVSSHLSLNYSFPLAAGFRVQKWTARNRVLVIGSDDGRMIILDFGHLFC